MSDRSNKAIQLIELLSERERKAFSNKLDSSKRKSLRLLFEAIGAGIGSKDGKDLEKEVLFRKTYSSIYATSKDYLLRNELRLLSVQLTSFLAQEQVRKNFKEDPIQQKYQYLRSLIERNALDLFEREWEKVVDEAELNLDFHTALAIRRLAIEQSIQNKPATIENYNALLAQLEEFQKAVRQDAVHQHLFGKHKEAFTTRTLRALGQNVEFPDQDLLAGLSIETDTNNPYSKHLVALTRSYAFDGKEKIELLVQASESVKKIDAKSFDSQAALASINAGIGLEYFLLGEFEKSLPFHQNALLYGSKLDTAKLISFVFNYLSTLIRLQRYDQAIELIDDYSSVWQKLPRMEDRFRCLKAMCHVFLHETEAAEDCLPDDRKAGGMDHYYYYRFVQLIVLYRKGKVELAINETDNFEHTVRYNDKDDDYLKLIQATRKFLQLRTEKPAITDSEYTERASNLRSALDKASESAIADRTLLYRWLLKELE